MWHPARTAALPLAVLLLAPLRAAAALADPDGTWIAARDAAPFFTGY